MRRILPATPALQVGPAATASGQLAAGFGVVLGWGFREATGVGTAVFDLVDGPSASSPLIMPFSLSAGQSTRDFLTDLVMPFDSQLFLSIVSGSITGAVYVLLGQRTQLLERILTDDGIADVTPG